MSSPVPARGRPRETRVDEAVLAAAASLLLEGGIETTTIRAVALKAGVGLPSVYRRWATKDALVLDALTRIAEQAAPTPDTGALRTDLELLVSEAREALHGTGAETGVVYLTLGLMGTASLPLRRVVQERRRASNRQIVDRAIERGELDRGTNPDVLLDMLLGPLWFNRLTEQAPLSDAYIDDLLGRVLRAFAPATTRGVKGRARRD